MNSTSGARSALRDLFQFHFGSNAWLPALFAAVAVGAIVVLLYKIFSPQPGGYLYPYEIRMGLAFIAVICWTVSVLCAYAAGFVMGRLYLPRA